MATSKSDTVNGIDDLDSVNAFLASIGGSQVTAAQYRVPSPPHESQVIQLISRFRLEADQSRFRLQMQVILILNTSLIRSKTLTALPPTLLLKRQVLTREGAPLPLHLHL